MRQKKQLVEEIKEKFSKAKTIAFVDYRGLNVDEDTKMRRQFRENGCEYKVYKNRLMLKALSDLGIECSANYFEGTTAVALGYDDEVAPAKILCDNITKTKKNGYQIWNFKWCLRSSKRHRSTCKTSIKGRTYCKTSWNFEQSYHKFVQSSSSSNSWACGCIKCDCNQIIKLIAYKENLLFNYI